MEVLVSPIVPSVILKKYSNTVPSAGTSTLYRLSNRASRTSTSNWGQCLQEKKNVINECTTT